MGVRTASTTKTSIYVLNRTRKYNPASENITSGDHAAIGGGNCPSAPTCSNSLSTDQYAIARARLTPTPAIAPRLPARNANGIDTIAMMHANIGTENFLLSW